MRHRVMGRKLGRHAKARKALFRNLINSLVKHQEIKTTEAKAKAIKGLVDRFVSRAKKGDLHSRRLVFRYLQNSQMVNKLFDEIAPGFKERPSGFTRIIKLGRRKGDGAMMVKLEFVEREEKPQVKAEEKKGKKKKEVKKPVSSKKKTEKKEKKK